LFQLRPYQQRDIDLIRAELKAGRRRVLYQLPTGGGKTVSTSFMLGNAERRGIPGLFIVHRQELLLQASRTLTACGIAHGLIAPGHSEPGDRVQVATVQTLVRRLGRLPKPGLIVFDEAHHCAAGQWRQVAEAYADARMVGVTATPERLDGRGLGDMFESMVRGLTVAELMATGFLCEYAIYAPPTGIDMAGVRTQAGDFSRGDLARAVDRPTITGDAVDHYRRLAPGRRAIAFCVSVEHSRHVAEQFRAAGIRAAHVDGGTDRREREATMAAFARGDIQVLTNCDLISEGFDVPAVGCVILLRPTKSLALYLQQIGRGLRPEPGKDRLVILDHAGNVMRHGMPDDDRDWTLEGVVRRRGAAGGGIAMRQCPSCYAVHTSARQCPGCGAGVTAAKRAVETVGGELRRIDGARKKEPSEFKRRLATCNTLDDLVAMGRDRGMANPEGWARHLWAGRRNRQSRRSA